MSQLEPWGLLNSYRCLGIVDHQGRRWDIDLDRLGPIDVLYSSYVQDTQKINKSACQNPRTPVAALAIVSPPSLSCVRVLRNSAVMSAIVASPLCCHRAAVASDSLALPPPSLHVRCRRYAAATLVASCTFCTVRSRMCHGNASPAAAV